jgi:hypothetical protein
MTFEPWKPYPLSAIIAELLQRKGPASDVEILEMVKEVYADVGVNAFNKELMRLEIRGVIRVTALTKGKRRIEYLAKGESARGK